MLIYRRGVWDLPKGKKEEYETIEQCARREVAEELGIDIPAVTEKVGTTYHEYERGGKKYGKTIHWFAMPLDKKVSFRPQSEENIEEAKWEQLDEAIDKVGFENLSAILKKFKAKSTAE